MDNNAKVREHSTDLPTYNLSNWGIICAVSNDLFLSFIIIYVMKTYNYDHNYLYSLCPFNEVKEFIYDVVGLIRQSHYF